MAIPVFSALLLGFLMILDPCTLFTSIAAIGYIDRELKNRRRVVLCGTMFVLGKLLTYILLSIPFIVGAQTEHIRHALNIYGEPMLCIFMIVCGILLLFAGHHHHEHDHGLNKILQALDEKSSWLWSFMLGIFFAIAFCPHRLIYFFTMIDMTISTNLPQLVQFLMPFIFGLGTGLPILIIAWIISYTAVSNERMTEFLHRFERIFRYACAVIFLSYGLYTGIHILNHHHDGVCDDPNCHHQHVESVLPV